MPTSSIETGTVRRDALPKEEAVREDTISQLDDLPEAFCRGGSQSNSGDERESEEVTASWMNLEQVNKLGDGSDDDEDEPTIYVAPSSGRCAGAARARSGRPW